MKRPYLFRTLMVVLALLQAEAAADDYTKPTCVEARGTTDLTKVRVRFSEPVEMTSAQDSFNYLVPGFIVLSAVLAADQVSVTLLLDQPMNPDKAFQVYIDGVMDLAGNTIAPGSSVSGRSFVYSSGFALQELYLDIGGESVSDLRSNPRFPGNPSQANYVSLLEGPLNAYDNYGTRISGLLVPPVSGNYNFFMSADDSGELWLSTDPDPRNMTLIALEAFWNDSRDWLGTTRRTFLQQNRSSTFHPEGIGLVAGQSYYFELLAKEGGDGDNCAATWQVPGAPLPANGSTPIPGAYLFALADPIGAYINITGQPQDASYAIDPAGGGATNVTFRVTANASTESNPNQPIFYQWYRDGTMVPGANGSTYTVAATPADNCSRHRCVLSIPGATVTSYAAVLSDATGLDLVVRNTNDSGAGSLRAAIASARPCGIITFAPDVRGAITLTSAQLSIDKSLIIIGPGASLLTVRRSPTAGDFRIFNIASASFNVTISGLTIVNANLPGGAGGGIANLGTLNLINVAISGNSTRVGGGIYNNFGTVTITHSTISGNSVSSPIAGGDGGGIFNVGGTVRIAHSTISGNSANGPTGNTDSGGGILNYLGTVTLTNCTISGNSADFGGGIRNMDGGTLRARNTIIALNTSASGPDVNGPLVSQGFNLVGNALGATITPGQFPDQIGVTPAQLNLGPLQDNGGPTLTHALLSGSSAIDKGGSTASFTDQRGFIRPVDQSGIANVNDGDGGDIGALEFGSAAPYLSILSINRIGNGLVVLQVAGVANRAHRIQASVDLSFGSFFDLAIVTANAAGLFQYQDITAGLTRKFYRVALP